VNATSGNITTSGSLSADLGIVAKSSFSMKNSDNEVKFTVAANGNT
jgi:hypothetical protein